MNPESEYRKLLETRGVSLENPGLAEIALDRADAILATGMLLRASIPILGGDVYYRGKLGIESAYANWHSDPIPGEERKDFASRSCLEAKSYIEKFPVGEAQPVFVLVIDS